jgi:hypothetical protein
MLLMLHLVCEGLGAHSDVVIVSSVAELRSSVAACTSTCTIKIDNDILWDGQEIQISRSDVSITLIGKPSPEGRRPITLNASSKSRFLSAYNATNVHIKIINLRMVNGKVQQPQGYGGAIYIKGGNGARVEIVNTIVAYNVVQGISKGAGTPPKKSRTPHVAFVFTLYYNIVCFRFSFTLFCIGLSVSGAYRWRNSCGWRLLTFVSCKFNFSLQLGSG